MEKNPKSATQVFAITNIEYFISVFYVDPEDTFNKITTLINENKITEHEDIMHYFYELLTSKGYLEDAEKFVKMYNLQIEKG